MSLALNDKQALYLEERILHLSQALIEIAQDINQAQQGRTQAVPESPVGRIQSQIEILSAEELDRILAYVSRRILILKREP